jgi:ribonuclease J
MPINRRQNPRTSSDANARKPRRRTFVHKKTSGAQPTSKPRTSHPAKPAGFSRAQTPVSKVRRAFSRGPRSLKIIPLGGQEEVGRNMTVFQYGDDIVILDMGLQFPEEDMPGIDYIIPNSSYLKGKQKNIRGVIFSHGHLDHIGAAPILLEKLGNPLIIGRDLTLALIRHRQEDFKKGSSRKLKTMTIKNMDKKIKLGNFTAGFFQVEHSIMDAMGVTLETQEGTVIHPGDWAIERDPLRGGVVEYKRLANVKKPSILMLESLGAINTKERVTEATMHRNLQKLISESPGRVIIGTFASQITRIKEILEYAGQIDKKVALDGYSMKMNIEVAQKLGYVKIKKGTLIKINQIADYPDNKVIALVTGAQGESNAVLSRVIAGNHRSIKIQKKDTIIFSSSVIPGNERSIQRLKDSLYRLSDNVVHSDIMDVHVSGHSNKEDIIEMLRQIKPTYFLPVYANHFFLKEGAKLAKKHGFKDDHVPVLDNGSVFELFRGKAKVTHGTVNTDYVFVDGLGVGDTTNVVLRDRQVMAEDGMVVVITTIYNRTGKLVQNPDIISRGFVYLKENVKLIEDVRHKVRQLVEQSTNPDQPVNDNYIKNKIRNDLGQFIFQKTLKRPMVLPVIIKV